MAFLPDDLSPHRPMAGLDLSPLVGVVMVVMVMFLFVAPQPSQGSVIHGPAQRCGLCTGPQCEDRPALEARVMRNGELWLEGTPAATGDLAAAIRGVVGTRYHPHFVRLTVDPSATLEDAARALTAVERAGMHVELRPDDRE